jgi:hypothetical protein
MKIRGSLLWLKVALVIMFVPLLGYASNFYKDSSLNSWRNVKVTVDADYPEVSYGADYHTYVTIQNVGESALSVPLDTECHVGYKLLNREKRIIREKRFENGSCINFDYNNLVLVPGEYEIVDFYIGDLEPGIYRAVFEVPPKNDMVVDFKVLEPVDLTVGLGEECGFASRKSCEVGLVCNYQGVLPGMPGRCVLPEDDRPNYFPENKDDFVNWSREDYVYQPPVILGKRFNAYEYNYGYDEKTGYVWKEDFENIVKINTGRDVDVVGEDIYVRRDVALTALYRTMVRNKHPEDLRTYAFKDSIWSKYGNYIEEAARLGIIEVPESKIFAPDGWLTWEDLREWLRGF